MCVSHNQSCRLLIDPATSQHTYQETLATFDTKIKGALLDSSIIFLWHQEVNAHVRDFKIPNFSIFRFCISCAQVHANAELTSIDVKTCLI